MKRRLLALAAILALLPSLAMANRFGPPYFTDDPEPVDFHHWEVYFASIYTHSMGQISGTFPHIEVNYGAAPNLQLHIIGPAAFNQPVGGARTYGYGDTEIGVKYRLVQEDKRTPMLGVFPLVEAPTGSASKGLGTGQTRVFLPVWAQKTFGTWQSYGGGGYWINPGTGNQNYWFFGWQAQNQVTKQLSLGAEVFHATVSTVGGEQESGFNVGAVYDLDEGHHVMFSVGRDFGGQVGLAAYAAFQWTFGPHEKK